MIYVIFDKVTGEIVGHADAVEEPVYDDYGVAVVDELPDPAASYVADGIIVARTPAATLPIAGWVRINDLPAVPVAGYAPPTDPGTHSITFVGPYCGGFVITVPDLDPERAATRMRAERDRLMALTDWTQTRDQDDDVASLWAPYRRALRHLPATADPLDVDWPQPPAPIAGT